MSLPRWIYSDLTGDLTEVQGEGDWVSHYDVKKVEDLFEPDRSYDDMTIFDHLETVACLLEGECGEVGFSHAQIIRNFIIRAKQALGKGVLNEGPAKTEIPAEDKDHKSKSEARPVGRRRQSSHRRRRH